MIEVDGRLAIKSTTPGELVGMRIDTDDGATTLYRDRRQVIEQLRRNFGHDRRDRLVIGGVALSRHDIESLHPTLCDALPVDGDRFNLVMIAAGVPSNFPPQIRIATNDVQIKITGIP